MNLRPILCLVALVCCGLHVALGQSKGNLARSATAAASETQGADLTPEKAIDGDANTRWSGIPGHNSGVWFELRWASPVKLSEIVVRQFQRYCEEWDLETWNDATDQWVKLRHFGIKGERLPQVIIARFPTTATSRVRIANITNGPSFTEVEAYASDKVYPPSVVVASDLQGNYVGMLTDSLGAAPDPHVRVVLSTRKWKEETESDEHGLFTAPMHLDDPDPVAVESSNGAKTTLDPVDFQYGLTPTSYDQRRTSLDGTWRFALDPPASFWKPGFDDSHWSTISVPSNWEMQGFRSIDGVAGYRRSFVAPSGGGRLKLRFDGVYSGAEVWVNGQRVASHQGGFTPFEADVTNVVHGGFNVLCVRVAEHTLVSDELDHMSSYADFPLSGITRKVYLFRTPDTHISRYVADTTIDPISGAATLKATAFVVREGVGESGAGLEIVGVLRSPSGLVVGKANSAVEPKQLTAGFSLTIKDPRTWTAEKPNLYLLSLQLRQDGHTVQQLDERVGLRQTTIEGSQLLINGKPVKIRGTCHHDSDPLSGRAVTVAQTRRDLQMIKEANLNSLRTSHYPPIPELLDIADETGLYVEDEADFCWVDVSDNLLNAPRILQLTAEMIARDRNHPSVFMWSICNESGYGYDFERSHEWVRKNDPSRPTAAATSAWLEIATLHNPISAKRIQDNEGIGKPLLFDESWGIFQGIFNDVAEMWVDPGMRDYYVEPLIPLYRMMMDSHTTQGSQIWAWADDIFCVPGRGLEYGRGTTMSHFIDGQYAMPGRGIVGDAPWGVVDGWRREKPEFWITKKLHSPVKIKEGALPAPIPGKPIRVDVENQYDFTNLSELKVTYSLNGEKGIAKAIAGPHTHGFVTVEPTKPLHEGDVLDLRFENSDGMLVDEYRLPLGHQRPSKPKEVRRSTTPLAMRNVTALAGDGLEIIGKNFDFLFDKSGGYLRRCVSNGSPTLLEAPALHILPSEAPQAPIPARKQWSLKRFSSIRQGENILVTLTGSYPDFDGSYGITIEPSGEMTVRSSFKYSGKQRLAREIGLSFSVPRQIDILHWERNAEWSVYPPDHIGRPIGTTSAFANHAPTVPPTWSWSLDNSPMGTNDFRSTKRHIRSAWIAGPAGVGVAILSNGQQSLRAMVDTDRIDVNVNDWYGGTNVGYSEWTTNYGSGKTLHPGDVLESTIRLQLTARHPVSKP